MVPRANNCQQLLESLRSSDASTSLKAVRQLKNTVIGDKFQKQLYCHLNCVPALLELASSSSEAELVVQALAALGSLAYGVEDGVKAIVACNGIPQLTAALCSSEQRVVVAAARALKLVYKSPLAPHEALLQEPVLQRLVALLQQPRHADVAEAAANMFRDCCTDASKASSVFAAGAVPALVQLLSSQRRSYQEAAVECLEALTQHSHEACQQLLQLGTANNISREPQQQLQQGPSTSAAAAAQQPAAAGQTLEQSGMAPVGQPPSLSLLQQQQQPELPAVVSQLLQLMRQHDSRLRFLCAACIANLSRGSFTGGSNSSELTPACHVVLPHLVRLLAAAEAAAATGDTHCSTHSTGSPAYRAMLGLRGEPDKRFLLKVPLVLAKLTADRPELLKLAFDLDAVKLLLRLVTSKAAAAAAAMPDTASSGGCTETATAGVPSSSSSGAATTSKARARAAVEAATAKAAAAAAVELRVGCLAALGAFAALGDSARKQMVAEQQGKLVPLVVAALSDSNAKVWGPAAMCLKGLSRSVSLLRSGSIPAAVAGPLVGLLQDSTADTQVQVAAAGAVCNLLLQFSTVRPALLKAGALQALMPLTCSMLPELRQHACWALKNMAHECAAAEQAALLGELPYVRFRALLVADDEMKVQEQAVGLLQNLCKGGASIEQLIAWSGGDLLPLLEEQLDPKHYISLAADSGSSGGTTAAELHPLKSRLVGLLYATSNICSGYDSHQAAVMNSKVPALLLQHLHGSSSSSAEAAPTSRSVQREIHLAVVWCIINLLWAEAPATAAVGTAGRSSGCSSSEAAAAASSAAAVAARVEALKNLGFVDGLKSLLAQCTGTAAAAAAAGEAEVAAAAAVEGAGSSRSVVMLPPPLPADSDTCSQDLAERLQTALEQLGSK